MSLIRIKPTSAGLRHKIVNKEEKIYKGSPVKSLVSFKKSIAGRNNLGRITVRHKGGGSRKLYRKIDFYRNKKRLAIVKRIEYDPNRSANIALICYSDGLYSYVIAQSGMKIGDRILNEYEEELKEGSSMILQEIPVGSIISCVEFYPGSGAKIARSAGTFCRLMAKDTKYAILKLKSGEVRKVLLEARASLGAVSNPNHSLISLGKAGASRWRGIRPTVRGVAMNPIDHPHGGGEGKTSGGRHPVTPWGVPTKGYKTRSKSKVNKLILNRR